VKPTVSAFLMVMLVSGFLYANSSPDAWGPEKVLIHEYKFPAQADSWVLKTAETELWGAIYAPKVLIGPHPVLIFIHGAHGTCGRGNNPRVDDNDEYVLKGTCPQGYVPVPSHLGFGYMAERLASWGYIVVSVNLNRGLMFFASTPDDPQDKHMIRARSKMVMRHLELLKQWNDKGQGDLDGQNVLPWDLKGKIDFSQVGLLGLSIGGTTVRQVSQFIAGELEWPGSFPIQLKGAVELGGTDTKEPTVSDIPNTPWLSIVGMCDASVSPYFSAQPYIRAFDTVATKPSAPRAMYEIMGAVHAFFNTEWQVTEALTCIGHEPLWKGQVASPIQQELTRLAVMSFFRAYVGASIHKEFATLFDPLYPLPRNIGSGDRIRRAFLPSTEGRADILEVVKGNESIVAKGVDSDVFDLYLNMNSRTLCEPCTPWMVRTINWSPASENYFQVNFGNQSDVRDISDENYLQFSVNPTNNTLTPLPLNLSIYLVDSRGKLSRPVNLKDHATIRELVGNFRAIQPLPQTVRIPLKDFGLSTDLKHIRGVRWAFDSTTYGGIYLNEVFFSER